MKSLFAQNVEPVTWAVYRSSATLDVVSRSVRPKLLTGGITMDMLTMPPLEDYRGNATADTAAHKKNRKKNARKRAKN